MGTHLSQPTTAPVMNSSLSSLSPTKDDESRTSFSTFLISSFIETGRTPVQWRAWNVVFWWRAKWSAWEEVAGITRPNVRSYWFDRRVEMNETTHGRKSDFTVYQYLCIYSFLYIDNFLRICSNFKVDENRRRRLIALGASDAKQNIKMGTKIGACILQVGSETNQRNKRVDKKI